MFDCRTYKTFFDKLKLIKQLFKTLILLIGNLGLISCQIDPNKLANNSNLYKKLHTTKHFIITSYARTTNNTDPNQPIYIYT